MSQVRKRSIGMKYDGYAIGAIIRQLRKERKMTKDDLSEETGLSVSTITQLELGGRNLSLRSLYLLMTAFQCDANTLLNLERITDGQVSVDGELEKLPGELREVYQQFFLRILDYYKEVRMTEDKSNEK